MTAHRHRAAPTATRQQSAIEAERSAEVPSSIRLLRLPEVPRMTGLGKTPIPIYELQAKGAFPMRVQVTNHSARWVEEQVQAWLKARIVASTCTTAGR